MRFSAFDIDNWSEIMATLGRNKTRTFMTAFGIFWGTAILALCWGGGRGFQGMMNRNFQGIATNLGGIGASQTTMAYGGFNKGRQWVMTDNDIAEIRRSVDGLDKSSTIIWANGDARHSTKSMNTQVLGVEPDYWAVQQLKLHEGRFLNQSDEAGQRKVALIGKTVASQLFGDEPAVGQFIQLNGMYLQVVGVASQLHEASIGGNVDRSVVMPSTTTRRAYNIVGPSFMVFTSVAGTTPTEVGKQAERILKRNHSIAPDDPGAVERFDIAEMFEMVQRVYTGIDLLAIFVGFGTLLAGVIGVGNIMWIIVKERTNEFGIRRAIGATPADITMQILSESVVLTTIAGLAGITFSALILGAIDSATADPWMGKAGFELSFTAAIVILALFFVLGTAAGMIPAVKAMRINPATAINEK